MAGNSIPTNESDWITALEVDAPVFVDSSGESSAFDNSAAKRSMTYFADRTVYRATFDGGPQVSLTVYVVYGKPGAIFRIKIDKVTGPIQVVLPSWGGGFQMVPGASPELLIYDSSRWPYRSPLGVRPKATIRGGIFRWRLKAGGKPALLIALGGEEHHAELSLADLRASPDLFDRATHDLWNEYLASSSLVVSAESIKFRIGTTGKDETISRPLESSDHGKQENNE